MLGSLWIQPVAVPTPKFDLVRHINYREGDQSVPLFRLHGTQPLFFRSKMSCDVDGSPNAYNATNDDLALDILESAEGKRAGGAPDGAITVQPSEDIVVYVDGAPYVQPDGPFKGFFVSKTSLENPLLPETSPLRYLDARTTQYVVLPETMVPEATLGDLIAVYDPDTHKVAFAIYGDIGPQTESGEASLATIKRLGLNCVDGKDSPCEARNDILFVVFPNTAGELPAIASWPYPQAAIDRLGDIEFSKWGGLDTIDEVEAGIDVFNSARQQRLE